MKVKLIMVTLLGFATWMNLVQANTGPVQNCPCSKWSNNKARLRQIKTYSIQKEGMCSIKAIMFQTVKGKVICSNPNSKWAKHVIRSLTELETKKEQQGPPNMMPTITSPLENKQGQQASANLTLTTTPPLEESQDKLRSVNPTPATTPPSQNKQERQGPVNPTPTTTPPSQNKQERQGPVNPTPTTTPPSQNKQERQGPVNPTPTTTCHI